MDFLESMNFMKNIVKCWEDFFLVFYDILNLPWNGNSLGDSLDRTRRHLESSKMRHFFLDIKENSPAAAESAKGM